MLVNLEPYGRLGNRLFLGAHLVAFSLHFNVPVLNLGFGEYHDLFPWMEGNAGFAFPWAATGNDDDARQARKKYHFREMLPWSKRFHYSGDKDWEFDGERGFPFTQEQLREHDVYFRAWLFRGYSALNRHQERVLEVFRFQDPVVRGASGWVEEHRKQAEILIGVHIRWEDYRATEWFLDQEMFQLRMKSVLPLFAGKSVRFLVFSNEKVPRSGWGALDVAFSPGSSPEFDLSAMSRCDYLLAPPSTFSGWASFTGKVPLAQLRRQQAILTEGDFGIVKG